MTPDKSNIVASAHPQSAASPALGVGRVNLGLLVVTLAALVWSYWPTLVGLMRDWRSDPNYSVGQIVPLAALYLLWSDRRSLMRSRMTACWWGVGLLLLAMAARSFGLIWLFESAERYSFVLAIAGVVLLIAGREVFGKVFWVLVFLGLMMPLPGRVHLMISGTLQDYATDGAVFGLELLGVVVGQRGHQVVLNDSVPINIAEACSGLRMLSAFVVVAAVLAYIVPRPRWQKVVLVLSSVPVAIVCNVMRLVLTALLFLTLESSLAERFFHDFAGLTMMPMAIFLLLGELWVMSKLVIPDGEGVETRSPVDVSGASP